MTGRRFRALCSCGWTGSSTTREAVSVLAEGHRAASHGVHVITIGVSA
jgi:hypothetical protein